MAVSSISNVAFSSIAPDQTTLKRSQETMTDYSIVRCPVCKGALAASEAELLCQKCNKRYPIVDGIPVMLSQVEHQDGEQNLALEKKFYEDMFAGVKGVEDGHCIVYGHDKVYDFMKGIPRGTLLEAGCGGGHFGVALARRGFKVTAIDLTVNGVRAARALAKHEKQDITYLCGDIKELPFKDGEFDVCFCSLVLHHFLALDNLVKELSRVTKKCFIAFEVNGYDPMSFFRFNVINPTVGIWNISKNQRVLFPNDIIGLLKRNGFKEFAVQYEDMHDNLGKAPRGLKARTIRAYQAVMQLFPSKYSKNKFLLSATK
jgi:SAM-dependent methyltransferase